MHEAYLKIKQPKTFPNVYRAVENCGLVNVTVAMEYFLVICHEKSQASFALSLNTHIERKYKQQVEYSTDGEVTVCYLGKIANHC